MPPWNGGVRVSGTAYTPPTASVPSRSLFQNKLSHTFRIGEALKTPMNYVAVRAESVEPEEGERIGLPARKGDENKSEGGGPAKGVVADDSVVGLCACSGTHADMRNVLVKAPRDRGSPSVQGLRDFISGILLVEGSEIDRTCVHPAIRYMLVYEFTRGHSPTAF